MNHLYASLAVILGIVILITLLVFLSIKVKKKKKDKQIDENLKKQETFTEEQIENIANNVSDKQQFIETISKPSSESKLEKKEVKGKKKTTPPVEESVVETPTETAEPKKKKTTKKVKEEKPTEIVKEPAKVVETPTETAEPKKKKATKKVKEEKPTEIVKEPAKVVETPTETASETPQEETKTSKRNYLGKWKIKQEDGRFFALLIASNGGTLLITEPYTTLSGLKNGIGTIKKNIVEGNFVINSDKYGHFRFKLYSKQNRLICISEDYSSKAKCEKGIESVKRFAKDAYIIVEEN